MAKSPRQPLPGQTRGWPEKREPRRWRHLWPRKTDDSGLRISGLPGTQRHWTVPLSFTAPQAPSHKTLEKKRLRRPGSRFLKRTIGGFSVCCGPNFRRRNPPRDTPQEVYPPFLARPTCVFPGSASLGEQAFRVRLRLWLQRLKDNCVAPCWVLYSSVGADDGAARVWWRTTSVSSKMHEVDCPSTVLSASIASSTAALRRETGRVDLRKWSPVMTALEPKA